MQYLFLYTSCLFSVLVNNNIVDIEKPDGLCLPTFVVDEFSGLSLKFISLFYYALNSNISISLDGITTLQKYLFLHTFL